MKVYVLTHFIEEGQPGYFDFVSAHPSEDAARTKAGNLFARWPEKDRVVWRDGHWLDEGLVWVPYDRRSATPGHRGLSAAVRAGDETQEVLYVIFECEV